MAYMGRKGAAAPLTSADIPDGSITTAKIVDDNVTAAKIPAGAVSSDVVYLENNASTQDLSGTYSTERLYFNDSYQLTGDVTVTGHLALGTIADADVVITNDGTARTLTGGTAGGATGTLEAGGLLAEESKDLTGMTGVLESAVTGSPNLNLTTGTLGSGVTFPAGHILKTTFALCSSSPEISSSNYSDVVGCSLAYTMLSSSNTLMILGMGTVNRGSQDGQSGVQITKDGAMIAQVENRDHNDNDRFPIPNVRVAGYSGSTTFNLQIRSVSSNNKTTMSIGDGYAIMEIQG